MKNDFFSIFRDVIRNNRRSLPVSVLASFAEKYLRAYYNESFFDFSRNGERFAIERFAMWLDGRECLTWDVGANHGQWAKEFHHLVPGSQIFSFEIIPSLAQELVREAHDLPWWTIEAMGLSDQEGSIEVSWNQDHDTTSSVEPGLDDRWFAGSKVERVLCPVTTLDSYWRKAGQAPDFLKIDVEGHDWAVLLGGDALLASEEAPAIIQFEYGRTWLAPGKTLGPIQKRLQENGYAVGRLYPRYVDFRSYAASDDHFRMGNMIAVKDKRLEYMLSK